MNVKECKLFNEKYITIIPEHFIDMPNDIIEIKYPLNGRPQIVKCDMLYAADYKFSLLEVATGMSIVSYINENVKKVVLSSNVSFQFKEDIKLKDGRGNVIIGFSFVNEVLDGRAYNVICHKQFGCELINMSMSCSVDRVEELLPQFKDSLMFLKKKI